MHSDRLRRAPARIAMGLLAALLFALPAACGKGSDAPTTRPVPKAIPITVAGVQRLPVPIRMEIVGTLFGQQEATLSAKVSGQVIEQLKDLGDRVNAGDVLARIDPAEYKLAVAQAQISVKEPLAELGLKDLPDGEADFTTLASVRRAKIQAENAKSHLDRASQLYNQKPPVISEQEFADMQATYQVAQQDYDVAILKAQSQLALARVRQSQLDVARKRLADTDVKTPDVSSQEFPKELTDILENPGQTANTKPPFAVFQRLVSQGEYVREGTPMYRVVMDGWLIFRGAAPEQLVGDIHVGQTASMRLDSANQDFAGVVSRVSPAVDVDSRTFQVEILFNNRERSLLPGSFARVQVTTDIEQNVLHVRDSSVSSFAGVDKIFGITDGKAVEYRIRRGAYSGTWLAVYGDKPINLTQTIDSNLDKITNGSPVTIETPPIPATQTDVRPQ